MSGVNAALSLLLLQPSITTAIVSKRIIAIWDLVVLIEYPRELKPVALRFPNWNELVACVADSCTGLENCLAYSLRTQRTRCSRAVRRHRCASRLVVFLYFHLFS